MTKRILRPGVITLAAAIAVSCGPDVTDEETRANASLIVYGRITNDTGAGIAGARVNMSYNPLLCSTTARTRQDATTAADGRYREVLVTVAEDLGCVRLRVEATGYLPDSVARSDGRFRPEAPFDSVQTNFTLRRR